MSMERRDPAVCKVQTIWEARVKIKTPISLQDLRKNLYIKAKAEPTWRFWGLYVTSHDSRQNFLKFCPSYSGSVSHIRSAEPIHREPFPRSREVFRRTARSRQGRAGRRGEASLYGEDRSEIIAGEGMAQGFGIPIVSTQRSILSRPPWEKRIRETDAG